MPAAFEYIGMPSRTAGTRTPRLSVSSPNPMEPYAPPMPPSIPRTMRITGPRTRITRTSPTAARGTSVCPLGCSCLLDVLYTSNTSASGLTASASPSRRVPSGRVVEIFRSITSAGSSSQVIRTCLELRVGACCAKAASCISRPNAIATARDRRIMISSLRP